MPFFIVGFYRNPAVIILTAGGDWGHGGYPLWNQGDEEES
jgi:hypothetical protein